MLDDEDTQKLIALIPAGIVLLLGLILLSHLDKLEPEPKEPPTCRDEWGRKCE